MLFRKPTSIRKKRYVHCSLSFSKCLNSVTQLVFLVYPPFNFRAMGTKYSHIIQINFEDFSTGSRIVKWIFMNDFNFEKHITRLKIIISGSMLVPAAISYSNIGSKSDYNVCPEDRFFARYWFLSKTFFYLIERRNFCQAEYHEFHPRKKISFYSCQPWHNIYRQNINVFRWGGITRDRIWYRSVIYIKVAGKAPWKFNGKYLIWTCVHAEAVRRFTPSVRTYE